MRRIPFESIDPKAGNFNRLDLVEAAFEVSPVAGGGGLAPVIGVNERIFGNGAGGTPTRQIVSLYRTERETGSLGTHRVRLIAQVM